MHLSIYLKKGGRGIRKHTFTKREEKISCQHIQDFVKTKYVNYLDHNFILNHIDIWNMLKVICCNNLFYIYAGKDYNIYIYKKK